MRSPAEREIVGSNPALSSKVIKMKTRIVPVGVVKHLDKVLIVKRGPKNRHYPGKWHYPSGWLREFETLEDGVIREIKEETGLEVRIVKKGKVFEVEDKDFSWMIIPFLCEADNENVIIDENEVSEYKWISPEEIKNYDIVPDAEKNLEAVGLL